MKKNVNKKGQRYALLFLCILVFLFAYIIYSYWTVAPEQDIVIEEREEPKFVKQGILHFVNASVDTLVTIDIEIADTQDKITQGLMWRRSLGEKQGMLFIFPDERPRSFWMKNTYIPLDIIYVDSYGKIVSIVYNAVPFNERSLPSEMPAQYVVEVNAGFCNQYGLAKDDRIVYELE